MHPSLRPLLLVPALALPAFAAPSWERITLTDEFWSEGAAFGDFNQDGQQDLVYGPHWYAGPDFKTRTEYAPAEASFKVKQADGSEKVIPGFKGLLGNDNQYANNFFAYTRDFNRDGWMDIFIIGFPGKETSWFENPKGATGRWKQHIIFNGADGESPVLADLTGDGQPELVCIYKGDYGWADYDPKDPAKPWTWHKISDGRKLHVYTHGQGIGDVNGDGKADLLEKDGWYEQPASLAGDPLWKHHPFSFTSHGGAQMYAVDINGDGRNDVVTSLFAHGYGLAWFEQKADGSFEKHVVMDKDPALFPHGLAISQLHAIDAVDMNGDGVLDFVTGKRWWAHGPKGDADPNGTPLLTWWETKRNGDGTGTLVPHVIDDGSGVGVMVLAQDINGDKVPDIAVGNKRGAFVLRSK
jgi:FG-GAP-like repeat